MAFGIGNLGNIVSDFTNSLNEVFGRNSNSSAENKGGGVENLISARIGGTQRFDSRKWTGNARTKQVRYGFSILTLDEVVGNSSFRRTQGQNTYFLDIPPQNLMQKEIFANQIEATRRGVIVQSEGVVFRDIIIQGTTGVFPGQRGGATNALPNAESFTKPPQQNQGVDPQTGRSSAASVNTLSGYEEFISLRQFFLKYASEKVQSDGNRFLIFINEKDNQQLIVEPLEFNMERSASSPMTYNYKIVLKGIGDLNGLFNQLVPNSGSGDLSFFEQAGNVSANIAAGVQTARAVMNQSTRLLSRISESIDQTINGPLRQIQFATEDLNDGLSTILSLPEVLYRNTTQTILNIRDNQRENLNTVNDAFGREGSRVTRSGRIPTAAESAQAASEFTQQKAVQRRIQEDARVPLPRSFVENTRRNLDEINLAVTDFVGLGSPEYDEIKGRVNTAAPDPIRQISDQEIDLLSAFVESSQLLNTGLAANVLFQSGPELAFEQASRQFSDPNLPDDQQIQINAPASVREITIESGDTLERIAQREYGSAIRWLDLVIINNLRPPYLSEERLPGTLAPGDKILVGAE